MKEIKGFEGKYAVTDDGFVWSIARKKFLKSSKNGKGIDIVSLVDSKGRKRTKNVHRLVADTLLDNPEGFRFVAHIEGTDDNGVDNLKWVRSPSKSRWTGGSMDNVHSENHPYAKLTNDEVRAIRKDKRYLREIADDYGVSPSCISLIKNGKNWGRLSD